MKKLCVVALCLGLISAPGLSFGASDGALGSSSTGDADINITIPDLVRITGFADFSASFTGSGDIDENDDLCVYRNGPGNYRITGTGSGTASAFTITDGSNTIAYTPSFNDQSGTTGGSALTSGTPLTAQTGADTSSQDCSSHASDNANLRVLFNEADLLAAPGGSYSGTITLVVEPE